MDTRHWPSRYLRSRTTSTPRWDNLRCATPPEGRHLSVRLMQDMANPFAASRAAYQAQSDSLRIDFGRATLVAISRGDLLGRGLMADLVHVGRQLVAIAPHRMRTGGRPRHAAHDRGLIVRLRGMLKGRINAALNAIVRIHAPAELVVERLNFRSPELSTRMNRLLTSRSSPT